MLAKVKEFTINAIGFTLLNIDIDPEFHDWLMAKIDKWFWPLLIYTIVGILSYII